MYLSQEFRVFVAKHVISHEELCPFQLYKGRINATCHLIQHPMYGAGHKYRTLHLPISTTLAEVLDRVSGMFCYCPCETCRDSEVKLCLGHALFFLSLREKLSFPLLYIFLLATLLKLSGTPNKEEQC